MKFVFDLILTLACTGSLLLMPSMQATILADPSPTPKASQPRLQPTEIEERKIKDIARQITVRIFWGNRTGSGILIDRQAPKQGQQSEYLYLVLTNNHVISNPNKEYRIETADGRIHRALPHPEANAKFGNNDLGILWFSSPINYGKAELGDISSLQNEDKVYVGGFPCEGRLCEKMIEFKLTIGAALLIDKPLVRGYQLAYTNETTEGTSGGSVLNNKGQVVAINGQGKYPISNSQYNYAEGDEPPQEIITFMKYFAWGIPINTYKKLAPQNPFAKLSPLPSNTQNDQPASPQPSTPPENQNQQNETNFQLSIKPKDAIYMVILIVGCLGSFMLGKKYGSRTIKDRHNHGRT